ncbi:MAG: hypothetical protein OXG88_07610 [Gammaproteobacteria bacterium]|nr:hypothetical protein [Gammaproteobacteria bacterium]
MTQPNQFEKAILDAAREAQYFHMDMTDGWYLSYSHESFLQNFIAFELFNKTDHWVNIDPSRKKIRQEIGTYGRRPGSQLLQQRFDLVVWKKSSLGVKAVIEIKIKGGSERVLQDVNKVRGFLKTTHGQKAYGYVLYYTDKKRSKTGIGTEGRDLQFIGSRFTKIDENIRPHSRSQTGLRHRATDYVQIHELDDPWGFALFRC